MLLLLFVFNDCYCQNIEDSLEVRLDDIEGLPEIDGTRTIHIIRPKTLAMDPFLRKVIRKYKGEIEVHTYLDVKGDPRPLARDKEGYILLGRDFFPVREYSNSPNSEILYLLKDLKTGQGYYIKLSHTTTSSPIKQIFKLLEEKRMK